MNVDDRTLAAVARVLAGERAEDVVAEALAGIVDNEERARISRRTYGVCVLRARLAYQAEREDAGALVDAYVRYEEEGAPLPRGWPADPIERMCVERSCPRPLVEALTASLGLADADAMLAASNVPGPVTLRANTLKGSRDTLSRALADEGIRTRPGGRAPQALIVEGRANLFGSRAWREGRFEVQDEGSQLVAQTCRAQAGEVVVDLCAGRGGKTLALAADMADEGALHVNDVDAAALADMKPRLDRAGVTCVRVGVCEEAAADLVLVDAPCTSLGTLRRSPDLRWEWRDGPPASARELPALQRALVAEGAKLLKRGGRLVYATCTVLNAENLGVVSTVTDLKWVRKRTLFPHVDGTDGFYIAGFTRA